MNLRILQESTKFTNFKLIHTICRNSTLHYYNIKLFLEFESFIWICLVCKIWTKKIFRVKFPLFFFVSLTFHSFYAKDYLPWCLLNMPKNRTIIFIFIFDNSHYYHYYCIIMFYVLDFFRPIQNFFHNCTIKLLTKP